MSDFSTDPQFDQTDTAFEPAADSVHFLKLQRDRMGRYAKRMRLRSDDVLVAVDGELFTGDAEMLGAYFKGRETDSADVEDIEEDEPEQEELPRHMLTFWRDGAFFHIVFNQPLLATYEYTNSEEGEQIVKGFEALQYGPLEEYDNYEVFRDLYHDGAIHCVRPEPLATVAPLLWAINHRLLYPAAVMIIVYGATLLTHWAMFVAAYALMSVYTRRSQLDLLRSYHMYGEKHFWAVVAERNEVSAGEAARQFDRKLIFQFETGKSRQRKLRRAKARSVGNSE